MSASSATSCTRCATQTRRRASFRNRFYSRAAFGGRRGTTLDTRRTHRRTTEGRRCRRRALVRVVKPTLSNIRLNHEFWSGEHSSPNAAHHWPFRSAQLASSQLERSIHRHPSTVQRREHAPRTTTQVRRDATADRRTAHGVLQIGATRLQINEVMKGPAGGPVEGVPVPDGEAHGGQPEARDGLYVAYSLKQLMEVVFRAQRRHYRRGSGSTAEHITEGITQSNFWQVLAREMESWAPRCAKAHHDTSGMLCKSVSGMYYVNCICFWHMREHSLRLPDMREVVN